ncbi:MAG: exosortase C-terminal domain/associated protein EpsI [bacterium]
MRSATVVATALIVICGGLGNYLRFAQVEGTSQPSFAVIPMEQADFAGQPKRFAESSYEILGADTTSLRLYHDHQGRDFWLFVAYFASQKYGSQMHSPRHCLPGSGWSIDRFEPYRFELSQGSLTANRAVISKDGRRQLMIYWFRTRGGKLTNEFAVKWDLVKNSLSLRPTDAAFVRLTLPIGQEDLQFATDRAAGFLDAFVPAIEAALPFDQLELEADSTRKYHNP